MPFFEPLKPPRSLPQRGDAIERAVMDFKVKGASDAFERAKDVAAFANHLGGSLVIGGHEDGHLREYVGLIDGDAAALREAYSEAVADRCTPRPVFDFEQYPHPEEPSKRIVVIN